ncbi:GntR family transcriptional regulator [Kitasatospora sp. NPDC059571]|uniref:GntR family transcriptional regulator n=1 Tax=Kitasatospora sp. NPDC059571 TaxID=3346871 RepID=UPI0036A6EFC7
MPAHQTTRRTNRPAARRAAAYLDIADDLAAEIVDGRLRAGQNLPSERRLAAAYGVNRQTVRAALQHLRNRGCVAGDHLGTYVLAPPGGRPVRATPSRSAAASFPGSFLHPDRSAAGCGTLLRSAPEPWAAGALALPPDRTALAYDHRLLGPDGRSLQSAVAWFGPALVMLVPQLGRAAAAADQGPAGRTEAGLGDLYLWAAMAGLRLRAADRVQLVRTPGPGGGPGGGLEVRRTVTDQHGRALVATVFRISDESAELRYADSEAILPADRPARAPGGIPRISPSDRAVLDSWASPNAPDRGLALRARIVLGCDRWSVEEVAGRLGHTPALVTAWRDRFRAGGLRALEASPRTAPSDRR